MVSTLGRISFLVTRTCSWTEARYPEPSKENGYCTIRHHGKALAVHRIVWETFVGPIPDGMTIDHIAKHGGDFIRERSDNRLSNLRLADWSVQASNKNKSGPRRDARPIIVWRPGEIKRTFRSAHAAQVELGIHANTLRKTAMGEQSSASGFLAEYARDDEALEGEEFREINGAFVSQFGRYLDRTKSFAIKPEPTRGNAYASFQKDSRSFHRAVALAWPEICGTPSSPTDTVDHIDGDHNNNHATNLRWIGKREQAENRTTSLGNIQSLRPGESEWHTHSSTTEACRWVFQHYQIKLKDCVLSYGFNYKGKSFEIRKGRAKGWKFRRIV